jgi:hypothetical protein
VVLRLEEGTTSKGCRQPQKLDMARNESGLELPEGIGLPVP